MINSIRIQVSQRGEVRQPSTNDLFCTMLRIGPLKSFTELKKNIYIPGNLYLKETQKPGLTAYEARVYILVV